MEEREKNNVDKPFWSSTTSLNSKRLGEHDQIAQEVKTSLEETCAKKVKMFDESTLHIHEGYSNDIQQPSLGAT